MTSADENRLSHLAYSSADQVGRTSIVSSQNRTASTFAFNFGDPGLLRADLRGRAPNVGGAESRLDMGAAAIGRSIASIAALACRTSLVGEGGAQERMKTKPSQDEEEGEVMAT